MKKLTGVIHLRTLAADMKFKGRIDPDPVQRLAQGISATGGATIGYDILPIEGEFGKYELRVMGVIAVNTDNFSRKIGHRLVQTALSTEGQYAKFTLDSIAGDSAADLNAFVQRAASGEYYIASNVFDIKATVINSLIEGIVWSIFSEHPAAALIKGADVIKLSEANIAPATGGTSLALVLTW